MPSLAQGLVFRLALGAGAAKGVDRAVFLALRGEEGHVECFWPVPLDEEPEQARTTSVRPGQLQFLSEDGVPSRTDAAARTHAPRGRAAG